MLSFRLLGLVCDSVRSAGTFTVVMTATSIQCYELYPAASRCPISSAVFVPPTKGARFWHQAVAVLVYMLWPTNDLIA